MNILFGILALLSVAYYVIIVGYAGIHASFSLFWLALGIFSAVLSVLFSMRRFRFWVKNLPQYVRVPACTTIALFAFLFVVVEGFVAFHMFDAPEKELDYLVVLGAQVRGERITKSLRYRLDKACGYLEEHPETKVIVTGGKGSGEAISEAAAMRNYLEEKGIKKERILLERYAANTKENIGYSKNLIGNPEASVGIVTNSFHVFRSVSIAKKLGMKEVTGIAAESDKRLLPNYMVREFFAVIKDKLVGNI